VSFVIPYPALPLIPPIYFPGHRGISYSFFHGNRAKHLGTRFVNVPIGTVNKRLTRESAEASSEITNLEKKLHYHETTFKNSRENLEQILSSGGRA
jgi:hypothetical protein